MPTLTFEHPWALLLLPLALALTLWAQTSDRRLSATRLRAVRGLRSLLIVLLVLALAGLTALRREDRLTLIFAVDGSRSVGGSGHPETVRWLTEAAEQIGEKDQAGIVAFGREAMIDTFPTSDFRVGEVLARPADDASDLSRGVRLARGLLPPSHEARLVLITDGIETSGSIEQALAALPGSVDVLWATLQPPASAEVLIEQVSAAERVVEGQPHQVRVVVGSSRAGSATLRLFRGAVPVAASTIRLQAGGSQVFTFEQTAPPGGGALLYRAQVEAVDDTTAENNQGAALVQVAGRPSILAIDSEPGALQPFARALRRTGMRVDAFGPGGLPADVRGLAEYDAVVLSDVAAKHFSEHQLQVLATWVSELGGGLLMLGGPESFGRGGYWKTPIEDVLPVNMEVKDRSYFPSLGLVICIDKSGSMAGFGPEDGGATEKLAMAKTGAAGVIELLQPIDQIGVIGFDAAAKWVVPMTSADNPDQLVEKLGHLRAGGGTDAYPAMVAAREALAKIDARIRHVILLTDGQLSARDHESLAEEMHAEEITLSTVGIGSDADLYTLERLADAGGGVFHHAEEVDNLPRIFLRDAFRVARSWTVEETFEPTVIGFHPVLSAAQGMPTLDGYTAASEKAAAQHLLATHHGDPLLSLWRVGLGKSVAFTSDVKSRWARRWLGWSGFEPFWAAVVRWTLRDPAEGRLQVSASTRDGRLHLAADLLGDAGAFVNGAKLVARVVTPNGQTVEVAMAQDGPGRYVGEAPANEEGPYLAAVMRQGAESPGQRQEAALVSAMVPYADEFRGLSRAPDAMERLVASGRVRRLSSPEQLFDRRGTSGQLARPLAPLLLSLAAVLLVLEVAVRKLALPEWLERRLEGREKKEEATKRSDDLRLESLRAARQRATQHVVGDVKAGKTAPAPVPAEEEQSSVASSTSQPPPAREEEQTYTSRLLKAKRRTRRR